MLSNVPDRSVISKCETFKDTESILSNAILVKSEVVGLYPSIPHDSGIKVLKNILDKRKNQNVSTADLTKMTEFILRNKFLNLMAR